MSGGSLWASSDFMSLVASTSRLDELLGSPNSSLPDILKQEDVIQECKAMNPLLLEVLTRPDTILELVSIMFDTQSGQISSTASEIFACEVPAIFDALIRSEESMFALFTPLTSPEPLTSQCAGFVRKVVGVLLQRKYDLVASFLSERPSIVYGMIDNIENSSMMDLVIMLGWDDGFYQHSNDASWLASLGYISRIVELLGVEQSEDTHASASYALVDLVTKSPVGQATILMDNLLEEPTLLLLLRQVFNKECPGCTAFVYGSRIVIALIQRSVSVSLEESGEALGELVEFIIPFLDNLVYFLDAGDGSLPEPLKTSYNALQIPLGECRLRAVELCCNLFQFTDTRLQAKLRDYRIFPRILDLFEQYPWHNILHNLVESAVHIVLALETPSEENGPSQYRASLFSDAGIISRLVCAPVKSKAATANNGGFELGTLAFYNRIAMVMVERQESDAEIAQLIGKDSDWDEFVDGHLNHEQDRVMVAIGGSRPSDSYLCASDDGFELGFGEQVNFHGAIVDGEENWGVGFGDQEVEWGNVSDDEDTIDCDDSNDDDE